jgi:hypothetical protein
VPLEQERRSGIRFGRREFPEPSLLLDSLFCVGRDRDLNGRTRLERDLLTVRVVQGVIDANFAIERICSLHDDLGFVRGLADRAA